MMTQAARQHVLDFPVDVLSKELSVARVAEAIRTRTPLQIVTLNAEMTMQALADERLGAVIRNAGLVVPDGSGVVWALRRKGEAVRKVAGVELVEALAEHGAAHGHRFYFLGAKPGVAQEAADRLTERYPGLVIAGVRDGYFGPDDEAAVHAAIRDARPDVLLVALGVPRQEIWIAEHQAALGVPVAMGVGGSFDVFAGRVRRAPAPFRHLHLEWLYRLVQEPWRFQRMRASLPAFVGEVIRHG